MVVAGAVAAVVAAEVGLAATPLLSATLAGKHLASSFDQAVIDHIDRYPFHMLSLAFCMHQGVSSGSEFCDEGLIAFRDWQNRDKMG